MPYVLMDPDAKLDFSFDWSDFLDEGGSPSDTISSAVWTVEPTNDGSPSEPVTSGSSISGVTTTTFVNGVQHGVVYRLICRATTGQGRISEQAITIRGHQR